jgi:hypothetical protein
VVRAESVRKVSVQRVLRQVVLLQRVQAQKVLRQAVLLQSAQPV